MCLLYKQVARAVPGPRPVPQEEAKARPSPGLGQQHGWGESGSLSTTGPTRVRLIYSLDVQKFVWKYMDKIALEWKNESQGIYFKIVM